MNDTSLSLTDALERALRAATARIRPDVLLLSGGLDSALLAAMWKDAGHPFRAVTVGLDPGILCSPAHTYLPYACNSDIAWAERVATALDLDWTPVVVSEREAMESLDWLLIQQRSFDLGQLNNIPLIAGLLSVPAAGAATFATGDDGDGLFGGYRFLRQHTDWSAYIETRIALIDPPARGIGIAASRRPVFPYLEPEVLEVARRCTWTDLAKDLPVADHVLPPSFMDQFDLEVMAAASRPWGKVLLRQVAERWLPYEIAWRPKTDLQFGSGMCALEGPLGMRLNSGILMNLNATGIEWFNDAHRALYLRFRALGLTIPEPGEGEYACRSCGGGVPVGKRHCVTCGCWPADKTPYVS